MIMPNFGVERSKTDIIEKSLNCLVDNSGFLLPKNGQTEQSLSKISEAAPQSLPDKRILQRVLWAVFHTLKT